MIMSRLPLLTLAALLGACTADQDWMVLEGPPEDVLREPTPGMYEGALFLDVKAYAGPVKAAERDCTVPFTARVSPDAIQWFVGKGYDCNLGKQVGVLEVTLVTDVGDAYTGAANGKLGGLDGYWDGWFYDDDLLYAEAAGESQEGPGRIEYMIVADAVRVGDLDEGEL
jgi:hypothetical protein